VGVGGEGGLRMGGGLLGMFGFCCFVGEVGDKWEIRREEGENLRDKKYVIA
jgi:hypothetical protein